MATLFWLSVAGVLYPYLIYPATLWLLAAIRRRPAAPPAPLPSVTLIIPVSNEEVRIAKKVVNTAALRYPGELLQILFVSDGSTDRTVELLRALVTPAKSAGPRLRYVSPTVAGGGFGLTLGGTL